MKQLAVCLLCAAGIVGCTKTTEIRGPNGQVAHLIECGGNPVSYCIEEANEICPDGYRLLSSDESAPQVIVSQYGASTYTNKSIVVECAE